ncbi:GntR family transcriptional regulator [Puniceicoccus vermicola]|uniref:GntR family transcriptional regulator n=1 Tax=Puniceicoccus vermicola TaxID=388746 RepID=A0A7X1AWG3_9BACT|nr:GntR family transcriptional regulator [Puniceicoccus vermicola]MBC2600328.1 GntR family transcriptional regulator [Puniceicoccus vermicola]
MARKDPTHKPKWKWQKTRTGRVADTLRSEVTSGILREGEKLPTYNELSERFQVSRFTIQNAINQLKSEGFLRSVERGGLFVGGKPPHLHRIALVYQQSPENESWPRFNQLLDTSAPSVFKEHQRYSFKRYYNVNRQKGTDGWKQLKDDIRHRRLAGVIASLEAVEIFADQIFRQTTMPLTSLFVPDDHFGIHPNIAMFNSSYDLFVEKALNRFQDHHTTRLAWLTIPPVRYGFDYFHAKGFELFDYWLYQLPRSPLDLSRKITRLLLEAPRSKRPNALMIADENLAAGALQAIQESGLRPGKDISVVAHMNWPASSKYLDPNVHWLGYHVEDTLAQALNSLNKTEKLKKGAHYRMSPQFIDELRG